MFFKYFPIFALEKLIFKVRIFENPYKKIGKYFSKNIFDFLALKKINSLVGIF